MDDIKKRIISIAASIVEHFDVEEYLTTNHGDLLNIDIDSIIFIRFVIGMEEEFGIEFDDEYLEITKFETLDKLAQYIESKCAS